MQRLNMLHGARCTAHGAPCTGPAPRAHHVAVEDVGQRRLLGGDQRLALEVDGRVRRDRLAELIAEDLELGDRPRRLVRSPLVLTRTKYSVAIR
jgi:hypothetical protein